MNLENIYSVFKTFNPHTDDYLGAMFINMFGELSKCYRIYFDENEKLVYKPYYEAFDSLKFSLKTKIDTRKIVENLIKTKLPKDQYFFCYSQHEYLYCGEITKTNVISDFETSTDICHFLISLTLSDSTDSSSFYEEIFTDNIDIAFEEIKKYIEKYELKNNIDFGIAAIDATNSVYTSYYDYTPIDIDIDKNYNDDFKPVYEKICNIIESEGKSSLMLFYGKPGTGKSSVLKNLISKYPMKEFVFIDGALLASASPEKLMSYFLDNCDTVFILEDCEKALLTREHYANPVISILLNLTDGIISDVLKIKFICTFNTALNKIDEALLRKGRLSLKYEFKELDKEKASKLLGKEVNKAMTLADIYNIDEENDFSKKPQNKIGF